MPMLPDGTRLPYPGDRDRPRPPMPRPGARPDGSTRGEKRVAPEPMPLRERGTPPQMPKWMQQFPNARKQIAIRGPMPKEFPPGIGPENYIDYSGPQTMPWNTNDSLEDYMVPLNNQARIRALLNAMNGWSMQNMDPNF